MSPCVTHDTSDARSPVKPHIVTVYCSHITGHCIVNIGQSEAGDDQSEASPVISRPVIHHPASCLMTTTFIVSASKYENVNRETQDSALPTV